MDWDTDLLFLQNVAEEWSHTFASNTEITSRELNNMITNGYELKNMRVHLCNDHNALMCLGCLLIGTPDEGDVDMGVTATCTRIQPHWHFARCLTCGSTARSQADIGGSRVLEWLEEHRRTWCRRTTVRRVSVSEVVSRHQPTTVIKASFQVVTPYRVHWYAAGVKGGMSESGTAKLSTCGGFTSDVFLKRGMVADSKSVVGKGYQCVATDLHLQAELAILKHLYGKHSSIDVSSTVYPFVLPCGVIPSAKAPTAWPGQGDVLCMPRAIGSLHDLITSAGTHRPRLECNQNDRVTVQARRNILIQLCNALIALQAVKVIHYDIKPSNFLAYWLTENEVHQMSDGLDAHRHTCGCCPPITQVKVVLTDFGLSRRIDSHDGTLNRVRRGHRGTFPYCRTRFYAHDPSDAECVLRLTDSFSTALTCLDVLRGSSIASIFRSRVNREERAKAITGYMVRYKKSMIDTLVLCGCSQSHLLVQLCPDSCKTVITSCQQLSLNYYVTDKLITVLSTMEKTGIIDSNNPMSKLAKVDFQTRSSNRCLQP